jgi:hypothetical protein
MHSMLYMAYARRGALIALSVLNTAGTYAFWQLGWLSMIWLPALAAILFAVRAWRA